MPVKKDYLNPGPEKPRPGQSSKPNPPEPSPRYRLKRVQSFERLDLPEQGQGDSRGFKPAKYYSPPKPYERRLPLPEPLFYFQPPCMPPMFLWVPPPHPF